MIIMQSNRCICGKVITNGFELCANCTAEYGLDRTEWPEWLRFLVADMKRERRQDALIEQSEISFIDLGILDN